MKSKRIKKALILMPFSIVKAFQQPLLAIAKILNKQKIELTVVHCRQAMRNGCNTMLAHKIGFDSPAKDKEELCNECFWAATSLAKRYPWNTVWLEEKALQIQGQNQNALTASWNEYNRLKGYGQNQLTNLGTNLKMFPMSQSSTGTPATNNMGILGGGLMSLGGAFGGGYGGASNDLNALITSNTGGIF